MSVDLVLYVLSFLCAVLAAAGIESKVNLHALAFALFVLTFIV